MKLAAVHFLLAALVVCSSVQSATTLSSKPGPAFYVAASTRQKHNKSFLILQGLGPRRHEQWVIKPDYGDNEAAREIVACATATLLGFDLCHTDAHGISITAYDGPDFKWEPTVYAEIMHECATKSSIHCRRGGMYMGVALRYLPSIRPADFEVGRALLRNISAFDRFVEDAARLLVLDTIFQIETRYRNCFFQMDSLRLTSMDSGDWHSMSYKHGSTIFKCFSKLFKELSVLAALDGLLGKKLWGVLQQLRHAAPGLAAKLVARLENDPLILARQEERARGYDLEECLEDLAGHSFKDSVVDRYPGCLAGVSGTKKRHGDCGVKLADVYACVVSKRVQYLSVNATHVGFLRKLLDED